MIEGFKVADVDTHHFEPLDIFDRFIEPRYKDRAPRPMERRSGSAPVWSVEGEGFLHSRDESVRIQGKTPKKPIAGSSVAPSWHEEALRVGLSVEQRLRDMNDAGVDVQVIYPTMGGQMLGREFEDPHLLAACCRAYNDWARDYCSIAPVRLRWAGILPWQDPLLAVEEVRRSASSGVTAFYIRPNPVLNRNMWDPAYDEVWGEIERLDIPVSVHNSESPRLPTFGDRMESHTTAHIISHPFEGMATLVGLIWFGVFERFPKLTVVNVEADAGWLPFILERMDSHWQRLGNAMHPDLTMSPSDYWRRNMFIAADGGDLLLPTIVELVGSDRVLFNTDYPHSDGSWPGGLKEMLNQPISDDVKRQILWDNAVRAFRLRD